MEEKSFSEEIKNIKKSYLKRMSIIIILYCIGIALILLMVYTILKKYEIIHVYCVIICILVISFLITILYYIGNWIDSKSIQKCILNHLLTNNQYSEVEREWIDEYEEQIVEEDYLNILRYHLAAPNNDELYGYTAFDGQALAYKRFRILEKDVDTFVYFEKTMGAVGLFIDRIGRSSYIIRKYHKSVLVKTNLNKRFNLSTKLPRTLWLGKIIEFQEADLKYSKDEVEMFDSKYSQQLKEDLAENYEQYYQKFSDEKQEFLELDSATQKELIDILNECKVNFLHISLKNGLLVIDVAEWDHNLYGNETRLKAIDEVILRILKIFERLERNDK